MKKLIVLLLFLSASASYSQLSVQFGPILGLTQPTMDYSGETTEFYAGTKYSVRSGFNYGAIAKVTLGPLKGRLGINFSSLSNSGQSEPNNVNSTVEVKHNMSIVTLGTELGINIPMSPIRPYFGLDLLFTTISGSFKYQGTSHVNSNTNSIQSASRTGLGFALGSEISVATVKLDLSLRYNLHNLFGKEYITNTDRLGAYTSLNDAKDPNYSAGDNKHPIGNDRTIATIQFQLGVLFGF